MPKAILDTISAERTAQLGQLHARLLEHCSSLEVYGVWTITGKTKWAYFHAGNSFARRELSEQFLAGILPRGRARGRLAPVYKLLRDFEAAHCEDREFTVVVLATAPDAAPTDSPVAYYRGSALTACGVVRHTCRYQDAMAMTQWAAQAEARTEHEGDQQAEP